MPKKILRLLGNRVAVAPMFRNKSVSGLIHYDMSRMDDKKQWFVVNVSEKVFREGNIKPGDHVLTPGMVEPEYEFSDGVHIINARNIIAKVEAGAQGTVLQG